MRSVLIVEDDESISRAIQAALNNCGFHIRYADTCAAGLELALEMMPSLLVIDIHLPDGTGWNLLEHMKSARPNERPSVIVAMSSEQVSRAQLRAFGIDRFLSKPFDMRYFTDTVHELMSRSVNGSN